MHSISTLTVSRERQKPASSMVKPTCMPNTRNAAISVQTVLIGLTMSLPLSTGSAAKVRKPSRSGFRTKRNQQQQADGGQFSGEQQRSVAAPFRILADELASGRPFE